MAEAPQQPEVWGQLGAEGVSQQRKDELRKKARRGDALYFLMLIPAGLALILGAAAWMWMREVINLWACGIMVLGLSAWGAAGKILLGRR